MTKHERTVKALLDAANAKLTAPRVPAQAAESLERKAQRAQAYRAMVMEAGMIPCELPWCGCAASRIWTRTAAQIKAMQARKVRGVRIPVAPESILCEKHVPDWRADEYQAFQQPAQQQRAA